MTSKQRPHAQAGVDRRTAMTGLAAMALGGTAMPALSQTVRGITPTSITLGATLALTGQAAVAHEQIRAGQHAYMSMINDRGGINGRKINLIFEDNEYQAQKGVTAVRKLVMRDNIFALIGSNGTAQINPVLPFLAEQNVPVINSFTGSLDWFEPVKPGIYGVYTPLEYCMQACGRWAAKDGHKKILVPYFDAAFVRAFTQYAIPGAKSVNPNVEVEFMPIKLGTVDYVPHALEIIRKKPDAVIGMTILAEFVAMVRELRAQGSSVPIYTPPSNVFESLIAMSPAAMEGTKAFAFTTSPLSDTPAVKEYRDAMAKYVTPAQKPDFMSLFTFAGSKVIVEALRRTKEPLSLESFYDALHSMRDYDTGLLAPVSFTAGNHQGTNSLFQVVAKNGRWVPTGGVVDAAKNNW
jgi:branched-chain amino acid transport system substrate-binding protein